MVKEPNGIVHVDFTYVDEYEEEARMERTVAADYLGDSQMDVLCDLFCDFLKMCGFPSAEGKRVVLVEEDR